MNDEEVTTVSARQLAAMAALSCAFLWFSQPPVGFWPLAMVAVAPWLSLATTTGKITKRGYLILWAASTLYWLLSLQGLRHAHPAMFLCWMALAGYLATYHLLFVGIVRQLLKKNIPLMIAAPIAWVGQECLRNYLLTGISAVMLGHSMADVPTMIQIADMFGTYGVSFVLVMVNVAALALLEVLRRDKTPKQALPAWFAAAAGLAATIGYGEYRLRQPLGDQAATFALIQRGEEVEYGQSLEREIAMFRNYARQSVESLRDAKQKVDAVVWPESMFTGGSPWIIATQDTKVPDGALMTLAEFKQWTTERRQEFLGRARYVQAAIAAATKDGSSPHLLAGCGVVHYRDVPEVFSGVISMRADGSVEDWYGKTHLVMFGEYIPIAPYIPGLRSLIPPGMGLQIGPGAKRFMVGDTSVAPNICIETAVERVCVNQLASLRSHDSLPDVIITVTNDGWFDDSSVIDHHLRCGQLVAVGCRRPILSAANNGPTAWIDSRGEIVERLATGTNGGLIAKPNRDPRVSLYVQMGDWPAKLCTLLCALALIPFRRTASPTDS